MTCLDISRCRVIGDIHVVVSSSSQAGQRMRLIAGDATAERCRLPAAVSRSTCSSTATVRCADVLHNRRLQHHRVAGTVRRRRRTGSACDARRSQRDAVTMMMMMMMILLLGAFHVHLRPNVPLSVVIHTNSCNKRYR